MSEFISDLYNQSEIESLDLITFNGRIKSPKASLKKILKDTNVYKIIASTASCYELSKDLFPQREKVELNKEEFRNSFFVSSVERVAKYHSSLKDSYPEQTDSILEKFAEDFFQFVKKLATASSEDDIEIQYGVKLIIDLRKYTTNLIEDLISDNKELGTKLSNGEFFYLFDYPNQDDLNIYLRFQKQINLVIKAINEIEGNDYEPAKFKASISGIFTSIEYVFNEFCTHSKDFVEKVLEKDALDIDILINDPELVNKVLASIGKMIEGANKCYDLTHALENDEKYTEAAVKSRYDKSMNLEIVKLISGGYRSVISQDEAERLKKYFENNGENNGIVLYGAPSAENNDIVLYDSTSSAVALSDIALSADNKNSILLESINYAYAKHLKENETTNMKDGVKVPNVDFTEFYDQPYDAEHARFIDLSVPNLMKFLQDYKSAIDKNGSLVRLNDFSDVVSQFCHNQVETVEQIQKNIEAEKKEEEQKKAWEKDNTKLCSNIVTDFSDPEKYPHNMY